MTPSKSLKTPKHDLGFDTGKVKALSAVKQSVFWWAVIAGAGAGASLVCAFPFCTPILFRAEMRSRTLLACGSLLLEDCVDVVHLAQLLEEGDEVQQLGVGHVVEPRGHRHLEENTKDQQPHQQHEITKNAAQMDMITIDVFPHLLSNLTVVHVINQQNSVVPFVGHDLE